MLLLEIQVLTLLKDILKIHVLSISSLAKIEVLPNILIAKFLSSISSVNAKLIFNQFPHFVKLFRLALCKNWVIYVWRESIFELL